MARVDSHPFRASDPQSATPTPPSQPRKLAPEDRRLRARRRGPPDVAIVVAQKIGTETTTYVRNIYKYYVAYRLTLDAQAEVEKAKKQVAAPPKS